MSITEIKNKILPVLKKYKVIRASLFGSIVRGDDTNQSDIDLMVELPEGSSLLELAGLKIELEGLLSREVDVLTYNSLHHLLKQRILNEQLAIV
jgi:hypothetical protein